MATSLDEELNNAIEEETLREVEFERLQQQSKLDDADRRLNQRLEQARKAARYAEGASRVLGKGDYADMFGELGQFGKEASNEGAKGGRRAVGNFAGKRAANVAQAGANMKLPGNRSLKVPGGMSAGGAAALGGAVAGALQGGGVKGIAGGAFSWWAIRIAIGALFTLIGFIPALLYLNLHYVLSKMGFKLFAPMFIWQKAVLGVANFIMMLALIAIPAIIGGSAYAYCQTWEGWAVNKASTVSGMGNFCAVFENVGSSRSGGGGTTVGFSAPSPEDDAAARKFLADSAGITINQPYPTTSLSGMSQATLDEIVSFTRACNQSVDAAAGPTANRCGVVVTGGTEGGHASGPCSHGSGNKFDLRLTTGVDSYIQNSGNFTRAGSRSDGSILYKRTSTGVIYALEGNHWDVGGVGCA